ncbi:hypothetical protein B0H10DRAFT_2214973 [Mycena sp. CBHHK59/15]|nr:hypothetical protein B0H10DRAFT_2214973 [Mycena sp. CBHHK59/15]
MLRRGTHDPHDAHLRQLLDQRRAATLDYDTPSVYSSPFFSPRPNDLPLDTRSLHSFRSPPSPRVPLEARSRLNELAESMLDLDDDSRDGSDEDEARDDQDTVDADHDDSVESRMSLLGPKMRFHSKAPWEMDSGALEEEDELDDRASGRGRDAVRKGLGFRSSSRGTTASSRPSGESSRSQAKPKRSFETTSSANSPYSRGGALHALGQASISSTSLVPAPTPRLTGLRLNFPLTARSDSPSSPYTTPPRVPGSPRSATHSIAPSPVHSRNNNHEYSHFMSSKPPSLSRRATNDSQSAYSEEIHPYANPDLVVSYADDLSPTPNARPNFNQGVSRSDSTATVTDSLTMTSSLSRSVTGSTLTPDTSASSMASTQSPRSRASMFHGKEISSPLPIHPAPSAMPNDIRISSALVAPNLLPGWTERSASPTFALISLEQARAQKSRSATAQNLSISSTSSTPFPEVPPAVGGGHSPTNSVSSRARARSISTGARAKTALQNIVGGTPSKPERRDSEPAVVVSPQTSNGAPPGKTLKHKKSGFMRLFNGTRGTEKEERTSPPPVPSLSDGYAAYNAQQQQTVQKPAKVTSHRVPAPQISPSMNEAPFSFDDRNGGSSGSKPTPRSLSINTATQSRLRAASAAEDFQTRTVLSDMSDRAWHQPDLPQSAPANVTEFPALKLRPVSTLFSAHFGDHIVSRDSDPQPGLETDMDTLSSLSPSTVISPITPGLLGHTHSRSERNNGEKGPMATISEDQAGLAQALQEQLATAKKAWQRHIWELEGQVRDLKAQVDTLRAAEGEYCEACGRGRPAVPGQARLLHGTITSRSRAWSTGRARERGRRRALAARFDCLSLTKRATFIPFPLWITIRPCPVRPTVSNYP